MVTGAQEGHRSRATAPKAPRSLQDVIKDRGVSKFQ